MSSLVSDMLVVLPIALLVVAQGGFFGIVPCACGGLVCVIGGALWLRSPARTKGIPLVSCLLAGLALAYSASSLAASPTLTTNVETGRWSGVVGMSLLAASQTRERRATSLTALAWLFVLTAFLSALVWSGYMHVESGMGYGRLQFTFQYANAAAAWFGAGTLLCLLAPNHTLRCFAALPATALLLTKSGGGLVSFALVAIVVGVGFARARNREALVRAVLQALVAVVACVALMPTKGETRLVVIGLELACCLFLSRNMQLVQTIAARKGFTSVLFVALGAGVAVVGVVLQGRMASSASTLLERAFQTKDGLSLWLANPLFGVGPNNWQYLFAEVQSVQYYSTVVHCSYVQTLVDAGIFGLLFLVAASVAGVLGLTKARRGGDRWASSALAAASIILVHALVDFDFRFCALTYLLALLLSHPDGQVLARGGVAVGIACVALCVPLCGLGLMCGFTTRALLIASQTQDYDACVGLFENNPFTHGDADAEEKYLEALRMLERYGQVNSAYEAIASPTRGHVEHAAVANFELGNDVRAATLLIASMEDRPLATQAFLDARKIFRQYMIPRSLVRRYNDAVRRSHELIRQTSDALPGWRIVKMPTYSAGKAE